MAVIVGDTLPDLWVGGVLGLLIVLAQRRNRLWLIDKISTRPGALTGFGVLVYFGYTGASGSLAAERATAFWVTLAVGCVLGVIRAWTLRMWIEPIGMRVQGTPVTVGLWLLTIGGGCIVFGVFHVGFGGLVLYEGASYICQQFATIARGLRARSELSSTATGAPPLAGTGGVDPGVVAHLDEQVELPARANSQVVPR